MKIFLTLLLGLNINFLFAQTVTLRGVVSDSIGNKLLYSNIVVKQLNGNGRTNFTSSNENGFYEVDLLKNVSHTISVYHLGFETAAKQIKLTENQTLNFVLKSSPTALKEVEVTFELPIEVKEDTITYAVDKFNTGSERKLKDVLKNLPGLEVEKNGDVFFQGRKVTYLLVEEKEFFNGATKLGVENIPADTVEKIQVLENYNSVSFLKGLSDEDHIAVNVKLKEGKKRFVFGNLVMGKGNTDFFKGNSNLFYYSPKTTVNSIANLNNIGDKVFTFYDYLNFQGGVNAVFSGDFNFKDETLTQFLETNHFLSRNQKFTALNINKVTGSKFNFSSYFILNNLQTRSLIQTYNEYTTFTENKEDNKRTENLFGVGNVRLDFNPNNNLKITSNTQFKRSDLNNSNILSSEINETTNVFNTEQKAIPTSLHHSTEFHNKIDAKHTLSLLGSFQLNANNQNIFWTTNASSFSELLPIISQPTIRVTQPKKTEKQNLDLVLKHFWLLNRTNHLYTTLGYERNKESFYTEENQILENEAINSLTENGFGNDTRYDLEDTYFGTHYKLKRGIFILKSGFYFHNYSWNIKQSANTRRSKQVLLPDLLMDLEFNNSKGIELKYALKTSFSNARNLSNRFFLQSYNSIFKGNENLENELYHSANIRYGSNSLYRGLSIFANISYTKRIDGYVNEVNFDNISQYLSTVLLDNASESISLNGRFRKRIRQLDFKLNGNIRNSNYLQKIDNTIRKNKNNSFSLGFGIETHFKNYPNIETDFKKTISEYTSVQKANFEVDDFSIKIDYDFWDRFIFSSDYSLSIYQNKNLDQKNVFETMQFMVSYTHKNTPWSFNLIGRNLFSIKARQTNIFKDYLISDVKEYIIPRIFMISIEYKI